MKKSISIFYSYSHLDFKYLKELQNNLSVLRREGIIDDWGDRDIDAGDDWKKLIDVKLEQARIVLLLVSANFFASDYCYEYEMKRALIRHKLNLTKVIPIILTDSDYKQSPLATIEVLPEKGHAIDDRSHWRNANYAYTNITKGIRKVVSNISKSTAFFNDTNVQEIVDMSDSTELKLYAIEKLSLKIYEILQSNENYDPTQVYWFFITLAKIGDHSVEPIIKKGLSSKHDFIVQAAKDALEILQNKLNLKLGL